MTSIYIDGKRYNVKKSSNLLEACLSLGFNIPYFCWHPALGSVGACRQCAVKQYHNSSDSCGRIVMSCMTEVTDALRISINDNEVYEFRKAILELLMINHPHDCPVCEEGGHCHLQDMTVMTKQYMRRYRFSKRTHNNQYLGPFIRHEMNRCINCYRCVRYYKDYADGDDFGVYGAHDNLYFGRVQDGLLENEFSGNLVDICPTGVFTNKTYSQYYARKWDIQFAPSICTHCSIGCNISFGERYGKLCCVENRYNGSVNGYFLCDRGRFGYDYINNDKNRLRFTVKKQDNSWIKLNINQALQEVTRVLRASNKVIGIGSVRASIESNFALRKLVGSENFFIGINRLEYDRLLLVVNILQNIGVYIPSLSEVEDYDAILLLGEDVTQTNPRIALAIRQAVKRKLTHLAQEKNIPKWHANAVNHIGQDKKYPLFITSIDKTKLDDIASWTYYASLDDQAYFGFSIAHIINNVAPGFNGFIDIKKDSVLENYLNIIANSLLQARKPLIISGINSGSKSIISAAANIAKALKMRGKDVGINLLASDPNSIGLAIIGGGNLDDVLDMCNQNISVDSLIVLENDLYRHGFESHINNMLSCVKNIIVLDYQKCTFHNQASLILASASFPESNGTLVNYEGRAQRFFQAYDPMYYDPDIVILESWRWLYALYFSIVKESHEHYINFDDVINDVVTSIPFLSRIKDVSPQETFRIFDKKLARLSHRYSGRAAMYANIDIHEPSVLQDKDSMFSFSIEGNNFEKIPRQHIAFAWSPGWNSVQAWNKFQDEIGGHLYYGDPGVRLFVVCDNSVKDFNWFIPERKKSVFKNHCNQWHVVPYWHMFGSDEMSQRSVAVQKCMPKAYVVLSRSDAIQLNIQDKRFLVLQYENETLSLPLIFSDTLISGNIGLSVGFPEVSLAYLGVYIKYIQGVI